MKFLPVSFVLVLAALASQTASAEQFAVFFEGEEEEVYIGSGDTVAYTNDNSFDVQVDLADLAGGDITSYIVQPGEELLARIWAAKMVALWDLQKGFKIHSDGISALCSDDCFAAGTLVMTPTGLRTIESLAAGDLVLTGAGQATPIQSVQASMSTSLVDLTVAGETIRTTRGHPFLTRRGWVDAGELRAGDTVHAQRGLQRVDDVSAVTTQRPQPVYNLTLESSQSFRVGRAGLVVASARKHPAKCAASAARSRSPSLVMAVARK